MIIETLLNLIKAVLLGIFSLLPSMESLQLPVGFIEWFLTIMNTSAYFLPLSDFLIMFGIWIMVTNFHIIWKMVSRIWDALPFT